MNIVFNDDLVKNIGFICEYGFIEKLFGIGYVSAKVAKQIKDYRELYNYTYSGMLGTLVYWYDVKQAPLDKANGGIGIVPYIYEQGRR